MGERGVGGRGVGVSGVVDECGRRGGCCESQGDRVGGLVRGGGGRGGGTGCEGWGVR